MTDSTRLRWGILGTGMIAKKFAADLPHSESGELTATASRSQESADQFADQFGGRGIAGNEALLADPEIDAVYVALPNGLHRETTIAALRAGKHVLCEKPMARNAAEAVEMFAVAEDCDRVLVEAFMYRAHPLIRKLVETVRSGAIGDLRLMRSNFTFAREASQDDARYHPEQAGGALMDVGCYCIHLARALAGSEPVEAHAIAHLHPFGVDDYAAGTLKFGDDFLVTFTCGMTVQSDPGTFIAGTEGTIQIDQFWFGQDEFTITKNGETEKIDSPATKPVYALEADAFAEAVQGGSEPWISKDDTLGNMRLLDALRRSAGVPVPE
jgi:predicted dehydrogenase